MKKYILSLMVAAASAISFTACVDDTTEGLTRITTYPVLTLNGEDMIVPVNGSFSDPGCTADLGGEDYSNNIKVNSNVNTSEMGIYSVVYSAQNEDGFSASVSRTVYVTNGSNFDNLYWGETVYGTRHFYNAPVMITKLSDGSYLIDDILAGFYWNGRYPGYEPNYDFHAESIITLNDDNTIGLVEVGSWYFGSNEIAIANSSYDPTTGKIEIDLGADFEGFSIVLTLIK